MKNKTVSVGILAASAALMAGAAHADLNFYCSAQEEWCQIMEKSFEEATGIDVDMTRKSSRRDLRAGEGRSQPTPRATSGGAARATRICRPPRKT
jgi:hypothetical protein